jgi:hypothetical protein
MEYQLPSAAFSSIFRFFSISAFSFCHGFPFLLQAGMFLNTLWLNALCHAWPSMQQLQAVLIYI